MVEGLRRFVLQVSTELNITRRLWHTSPAQWVVEWQDKADALLEYSRQVLDKAIEGTAPTARELELIDEGVDALNACFPACEEEQ